MPFCFTPEVLAVRAATKNHPHTGAEICYRFASHRGTVWYAHFPSDTKAAESHFVSLVRRFFPENKVSRPATVTLRIMDGSAQDVDCMWKGVQDPEHVSIYMLYASFLLSEQHLADI